MIDLVIARLKDQVDALNTVEGAAEFAALTGAARPPSLERQPAAYVVPLSDAGEPNPIATGGFRQRITEQFSIVVVYGKRGDPRGEKGATAIDPVNKAIRAALMGWSPSAEFDPVEYVNGALIGLRDGMVWWRQAYRTKSTEEI